MPRTLRNHRRPAALSGPNPHLLAGLAAFLCIPLAHALADGEKLLAIQGARIETLAGEPLESGVILIADGRIKAIGADIEVPPGATVIDARGHMVFPGIVRPCTQLGLSRPPSGSKPESTPHYRVADELYAFQDGYKLAARAGFTTLGLFSIRRGIPGQGALVRTLPNADGQMLLSDRGPLMIYFRADTDTRSLIKKALDAASKDESGSDPRTAPLSWAVHGRIPVIVQCSNTGDMVHAIKLMAAYKKMKLSWLCSSSEIHRLAEQLGKSEARVIVPARISYERFTRNRINVPRILTEAGAKVACLAPSSSAPAEAVRLAMAELVRAGLTRDEALRAITIHPAEVLGLDHRLGTLEPGKDANLIILDGDIFDARASILRVLIEGETVYDADWGGLR